MSGETGLSLREAVAEFLRVSDSQASEGRDLAAATESDAAGALTLTRYFDDWGPKIEANWAMLREALIAFDCNPTRIAEGWWHPNVKGGQVHDHDHRIIQSMHRLCEPVYTRRGVASTAEAAR